MLVTKPFFLEILLDSDLLAQPLAEVDLTVTALADGLDDLDLLLRNQKIELNALLGHVGLNLSLHVLLRPALLPLPALLLLPLLLLSLLLLLLSLTVRGCVGG